MMDLGAYRREFPITQGTAFLNHAGWSPLSVRAKAAIERWAGEAAGTLPANEEARTAADRARVSAAAIMGAKAREIAFLSTTSEGVSAFAQSLDWRVGDNVVTAANEFPSNVYPWLNLKRRGVQVKMVKPGTKGRIGVDDLMAAADGRTRAVAISWVGYNSGYRMDMARLGSECRKRGAHFFVDAIQGLGAMEMKAAEWQVTAAAAETHKWLLGLEGLAVFYVSEKVVGGLHPPTVGWRSVKDRENFMEMKFELSEDARRFEAGCLHEAGIRLFGASMGLFGEVGMSNVTARIRELTDRLCAGVKRKGIGVLSSRDGEEWSGIVSFRAPGGDGPTAAKGLKEKGFVLTGRADFLRVSPHFYNSNEEIDRLVAEL